MATLFFSQLAIFLSIFNCPWHHPKRPPHTVSIVNRVRISPEHARFPTSPPATPSALHFPNTDPTTSNHRSRSLAPLFYPTIATSTHDPALSLVVSHSLVVSALTLFYLALSVLPSWPRHLPFSWHRSLSLPPSFVHVPLLRSIPRPLPCPLPQPLFPLALPWPLLLPIYSTIAFSNVAPSLSPSLAPSYPLVLSSSPSFTPS